MLTLTSPHKTWAHPLPAGGKLAALFAVTAVLFALKSPLLLGIYAAGAAGMIATCGADFARVSLRAMRPLWPFVLIVAIWHDPSWASIILRMLTAVALANFVTMTTRLTDMIAVLEFLARPLAWIIPPRRLALAIALVIRFIPVMMLRADEIALAWRARSARRGNWRIIAPITLSALDDAARISEALRARGGVP